MIRLYDLGLYIYDQEFMKRFVTSLERDNFTTHFRYPLISHLPYRIENKGIAGYINPQFRNKPSTLTDVKLISLDPVLDRFLERYNMRCSLIDEEEVKRELKTKNFL